MTKKEKGRGDYSVSCTEIIIKKIKANGRGDYSCLLQQHKAKGRGDHWYTETTKKVGETTCYHSEAKKKRGVGETTLLPVLKGIFVLSQGRGDYCTETGTKSTR